MALSMRDLAQKSAPQLISWLEGKEIQTADDSYWIVRNGCYGKDGCYKLIDSPLVILRLFVKNAIWCETDEWPLDL